MPRMTRRQFLGWMAKGAAGAGMLRLLPGLPQSSAEVARAQSFPLAAAAQGTETDIPKAILTSALDALGGLGRFVQPGMRVAIKPNATWAYPPGTASSSDPELLRALIQMVKDAGAGSIIVMDHCSIDPGTAEAIRVSGIGNIVKEEDVEGLFPDRNNAHRSTYAAIELPNGKAYQKMNVMAEAVRADVRINLGLAKSHNVTKVTMTLKHMMGFLQQPGLLHAQLEQGIADLSTPSALQAQLHILEALRVRLPYGSYRVCAGPETELTNPNVVQRRNQVIAGTDPVLIDSYGCTAFFDMLPDELPYILRAVESGVGSADIQAALEDGRFQMVNVGAALPTANSPTPTLTTIPAESPQPAAGLTLGTSTPFPTATPLSVGGGLDAVGIQAANNAACAQPVVDARPILNLALIPAAGVVVGAGMVAATRVRRKPNGTGSPHDGE